jgi:flagellar protein FlaG
MAAEPPWGSIRRFAIAAVRGSQLHGVPWKMSRCIRTRRYGVSMEIPGILKANPVQDVVLKEARAAADRPVKQADQPQMQLTRQQIEAQAKALQDTFLAFDRKVVLSVNDQINQVIIKVVDAETDKVIKEIPAEEIQHLIARIKETIGLLVDEKI